MLSSSTLETFTVQWPALVVCVFVCDCRCPNPQDQTVYVVTNGVGMTNTFSFTMFQFAGSNRDVYLHCQMELCTTQGRSCVPVSRGGDKIVSHIHLYL